jgi:hypothetical protein
LGTVIFLLRNEKEVLNKYFLKYIYYQYLHVTFALFPGVERARDLWSLGLFSRHSNYEPQRLPNSRPLLFLLILRYFLKVIG